METFIKDLINRFGIQALTSISVDVEELEVNPKNYTIEDNSEYVVILERV